MWNCPDRLTKIIERKNHARCKSQSPVENLFRKGGQPVEIVAYLEDSDKACDLQSTLQEILLLSERISLVERTEDNERKPSFSINRLGTDISVRFVDIPLGHEFTSLVLALLQVGGHPFKLEDAMIEQICNLDGEYQFETYISLSCQCCTEVVQALNVMSIINPRIHTLAIDGAMFQKKVEDHQILAVPTMYMNGEVFGQGRSGVEEILAKLDSGASARQAAQLIIKNFRRINRRCWPCWRGSSDLRSTQRYPTGVIAERFGGQVLDTLGIENFVSIKETKDPYLVFALEQHVKSYEVDSMNLQRAESLVAGKLIEIKTASGAILKSKTVIPATGARWREINVPDESNTAITVWHNARCLKASGRVAVIGGRAGSHRFGRHCSPRYVDRVRRRITCRCGASMQAKKSA